MLWLLVACPGPVDEGPPSIRILEPADGATVCGTPLVVEVEVSGLVLVDPTDTDAEAGTGHVDIALNGQDAAMVGEEHAELDDVEDGAWQLKAELSNADH